MNFLRDPQRKAQAVAAHPMLDRAAAADVIALLTQCFDYRPTPRVSLGETASRCGLESVHMKHEGARLGLRSFKALGGAYAVLRLLLQRASDELGRSVPAANLPRPAAPTSRAPAATD